MSESNDIHRTFGKEFFNYVWELLDKPQRSKQEDDAMLHAAHASRFHWGKAGTAVNLARGEWQISRVYSVLNRAEPALYHAQRSLEICQENHIGDFDLAYAYEALARAYAIAGNAPESRRHIDLAQKAAQAIEEQDNRELFNSDLKTIPQPK